MTTKWNSKLFSPGTADPPIPQDLLDEYVVILMQGKNVFSDRVYCYLKVTLRDLKRLKMAMQSGDNFTPSDFGTVVAAGKGEPTDEVKAEIAAAYKMVDDSTTSSSSSAMPPPPPTTGTKAWDEY